MASRFFYSLTIFIFCIIPRVHAQTWIDIYGGTSIGTTHCVYNDAMDNLLYVGGDFDTVGPDYYSSRGFATWDGTAWNDLSGVFGGDYTNCIIRYNGKIYHGLEMGSVYNGVQALQTRVANFNEAVNVFAVYNGELYAGGIFTSFDTSGRPYNGLAKYDGEKWSKVGSGVKSYGGASNTGIYALYVYNGELYAGGIFDSAGNTPCHNIAKWNGLIWKPVGGGVQQTTADSDKVSAFAEYNGDLIVGGIFNAAGGVSVNNIARWDGSAWSSVNASFDREVYVLRTYNQNLYAGGAFGFDGKPKNHIAKWDGTAWTSLGGGMSKGAVVNSLCVWNNMLIVGGKFDQLEDSIIVSNLAAWIDEAPGHDYLEPDEDDFIVTPSVISGASVIHLVGLQTLRSAELVDKFGKLYPVKNFSIAANHNTIELDPHDLASGIYMIRVDDGYRILTRKIIIL